MTADAEQVAERRGKLAAVKDVPPCERCKEFAKERKELRAQVRELEKQNERLLRAVQRESYLIDKRAGHDGSRYLKYKKEE
jgi:hypothetical protein